MGERAGLGEQRLEVRPVGQPCLDVAAVEVTRRQLVVVGRDVVPRRVAECVRSFGQRDQLVGRTASTARQQYQAATVR